MDEQKHYLLIDASAINPVVGILHHREWLALKTIPTQALEGIFSGVENCLTDALLSLNKIEGFIHCEGPGSVLGIRLSAMAIQTWKALPEWKNAPVWGYQSLRLIRNAIRQQPASPEKFSVISEARQDTWNMLSSDSDEISTIPQEELLKHNDAFFHYQQRKSWHEAPKQAVPFELDLAPHASLFYQPDTLIARDTPQVFEAHATSYKRWSSTRHR